MERDYTSQGFVASLVIHCLLVLLCLLIVFKTPIPPYAEGSGIELNYGTVDEGFGDVQTMNKANTSPIKEEAAPAREKEVEEEKPVQKEVERELEEVRETQPVKQPKTAEEKTITSEDEESEKITKKVDEKPKTKPTPAAIPQKKVEVDQRAVYGTSSKSNGTTGTKEQIAGNNNGDRPGKVGDQGNPKGTLDSKALYGNPGTGGPGPGGSGGSSLDMVGWTWDAKPVVNDQTSETGRIVFEVKIDSDGEIISIKKTEGNVSPSLVQLYEKEVRKLTFTKTSKGAAPPTSTGRITFIIRSR